MSARASIRRSRVKSDSANTSSDDNSYAPSNQKKKKMNDQYSPSVIEKRLRLVSYSSNTSSSSSPTEDYSLDDSVKYRATNMKRLISFRLFSQQKMRKNPTLVSGSPVSAPANDGPSTSASSSITLDETSNHLDIRYSIYKLLLWLLIANQLSSTLFNLFCSFITVQMKQLGYALNCAGNN